MTANPSNDLSGFLDKHLSQASACLLSEMLKTFAEALKISPQSGAASG